MVLECAFIAPGMLLPPAKMPPNMSVLIAIFISVFLLCLSATRLAANKGETRETVVLFRLCKTEGQAKML
jgi:hypothetical protein